MNTTTVPTKGGPADPITTNFVASAAAPQRPSPVDHFVAIAAELRRLADGIESLAGSGLPRPGHFDLNIQPGGGDDDGLTKAALDALAAALDLPTGCLKEMGDGSYHYQSRSQVGPISVSMYQRVSTEWAQRELHAIELAAREAELERLRAEIEILRTGQPPVDWHGEYTGRGVDEEETGDPVPAGVEGVPVGAGAVRQVSAAPATHVCSPLRLSEVGMSDCQFGCKIMRCDDCHAEKVEHRSTYGCPDGRQAEATS